MVDDECIPPSQNHLDESFSTTPSHLQSHYKTHIFINTHIAGLACKKSQPEGWLCLRQNYAAIFSAALLVSSSYFMTASSIETLDGNFTSSL